MRLFIRIQFAFTEPPMRKQPRQNRSRFMVQSLVDAAVILIAEEGLEAATAARIADRAGVSVGSLYQYFGSKEDIYDAVLDQLAHGLGSVVQAQLQRLPHTSIDEFVRGLLMDVWCFLDANEKRYLHVAKYWAQLDFVAAMNELENQLTASIAIALARRGTTGVPSHLPAQVYVLVNSMLFTVVRTISDPVPHVTREQVIDVFAGMVGHLLTEKPRD